MWSIRQTDNGWEVVGPDGNTLGDLHAKYEGALAQLAGLVQAQLAEGEAIGATDEGLLPEHWRSPVSALAEETGDGRDFTNVTWSWRNPAVSLLPLMLQTDTEIAHFGAKLAGFMATIGTTAGNAVQSGGRFYDSEVGRQFRDMLLGSRRFGVSVDPGPGTVAEVVCMEQDEDGWCVEGSYVFEAYEVIGLTGTPFPGFAGAYIELGAAAGEPALEEEEEPTDEEDVEVDEEEEDAVAAGGTLISLDRARAIVAAAPARPPRSWMEMPEPELGDPRLVEQPDGSWACPLTITDQGHVFGHAARENQCHIGYLGDCVTPPLNVAGYHLGTTACDDGTILNTGALVMGMDHPALSLRAGAARDAYANTGAAWADVRTTVGELGAWVTGALRPDVTPEQLRVLRSSTLSGDWREVPDVPDYLTLIAVLAVNVPGFPVYREAIAASGLVVAQPQMRMRTEGGKVTAMVASGLVHRCADCAKRAQVRQVDRGGDGPAVAELRRLSATLALLERRTRHLIPEALAAGAARVRPPQ